MAIYHLSAKPISRSSGRSAVASAAYRCAARLLNERDGVVHDFTRKGGVEHCEIVLPDGVDADWALDRSALWNAAEHSENRKDSRVAREFEVALPHELSEQGRIEVARAFAHHLADRYGTAVDFAIHAPHEQGDIRNYHAHVMMTTRQVSSQGLGEKTTLEYKNARLLSQGLPTTDMQLRDIRQAWEGIANSQLQREGLDVRIDHRSHMERGLELAPTGHLGVHATQMQRKGMGIERARLDEEAALRNAELIREKPEQVLTLISQEKSVFDRHDVARALHRYISDDHQAFQNAFASVMASPSLVLLQAERLDDMTGEGELARYSTREMLELERAMADGAHRMAHARSHGVDRHHVDQAMRLQDELIGARTATSRSGEQGGEGIDDREMLKRPGLSEEQKAAIRHITGSECMAVVVGFAGAGKSTMLAAARDAWERQGYKVHGAALSGKAAEGLAESSGIQSRTLASWSHGWQRDRGILSRGDVFVIDEAGMIGSRQLSRFVAEAEARGAKIVLVGDHEQLQAIGAGAPFRAIAEQIGYAELSEIRRQKIDWQRAASVSFATHKTAEALASYRDHGNVHFASHRDEARAAIVRDYLADREQHPDGTRVAMAHRRADVRALNAAIRTSLQDSHQLGRGEEGGEFTFQTNDGPRSFAPGDRVVFLENSRELGVKNGMLGEVKAIERNALHIHLDGAGAEASAEASLVTVPINDYQAIDHGYATTIHKNQGATVDRAFVLASGTMDRHLAYVAMTRHRDGVGLYVDAGEFLGRAGGKLLDHGAAPYKHQAGDRESYFVTLENDKGQRSTVWGVELGQTMRDAQPAIGERIDLQQQGATSVMLPDGAQSQRHSWRVIKGDELTYQQLENRLSRSGAKETTLDYVQEFAERRGIAAQFGVRNQIQLDDIQEHKHHERSHVGHTIREAQDEPLSERSSLAERTPSQGRPEPFGDTGLGARQQHEAAETDAPKRQPQRRSMFTGLKLNAGPKHNTGSPAQGLGQEPDRAEPDRLAERIRPLSSFEQAVDHYAQAFSAAQRQVEQGLPLLEVQRQEIARAAQKLNEARPGSHDLIRSALQHDAQTSEAMTEFSGRERLAQLVAGMDRERAALADPSVRADRFIERWQVLQTERHALDGWQHEEARGKVEQQLRSLSKELERDGPLDAALRRRTQELGISSVRQGETTAKAMDRELSQTRSQSLGLER
ncbi:Ti-type conjugative transfer relaxase TraA [Affinirhizobium pseudoryzae]|uniref:Ti-type conjugative transfer relaxase TraA n=1 Tax=Allorhizobium pseudoryzae TaxID=379684 RepID=UPI0019D10E19|nr:Ti-type conjugative transfer relaxase TraA [Allorhizobium pseudoryzae]